MSESVVTIIPLVPNLALPYPASPRTRSSIPEGYGVQEHCLPFTAASALGFLIPSPIRFGLCTPEEAPQGSRTFRSPFASSADNRVFYVFDNSECMFSGNAYRLEGIPVDHAPTRLEPGISFFDRADQEHLFKLHLPYIWRTDEEVDTLFLPLINRADKGAEVQFGLVETDWYASSVNLILTRPASSLHFEVGEPIAHAVFIHRQQRRATMKVAASHSRLNRDARKSLVEWETKHWKDRSVYKMLAREKKDSVDT